MEEELEQQRRYSLYLCDRLICDLSRNKEDANSFIGGDIYRAYAKATEMAVNKARRVKSKIRDL